MDYGEAIAYGDLPDIHPDAGDLEPYADSRPHMQQDAVKALTGATKYDWK